MSGSCLASSGTVSMSRTPCLSQSSSKILCAQALSFSVWSEKFEVWVFFASSDISGALLLVIPLARFKRVFIASEHSALGYRLLMTSRAVWICIALFWSLAFVRAF